MERKDGGPAYPPNAGWRDDDPACRGMSLRDAFAMAALPAIITATSAGQHWAGGNMPGKDEASMAERIAFDSYEVADAMLAQRDR